jgi:hypothetical protein
MYHHYFCRKTRKIWWTVISSISYGNIVGKNDPTTSVASYCLRPNSMAKRYHPITVKVIGGWLLRWPLLIGLVTKRRRLESVEWEVKILREKKELMVVGEVLREKKLLSKRDKKERM